LVVLGAKVDYEYHGNCLSDCEFRVNMLETALKVNHNIIRENQYARQQPAPGRKTRHA
jgi:hypothetical protein